MSTLGEGKLASVQYAPERAARQRIEDDPELMQKVEWARNVYGVASVRRGLLADAVRINRRILPTLHASLHDVSDRSALNVPLEAYVVSAPVINAAVIPSGGSMMVVLSSATIENLDRQELDFVVGHEVGHAAYGHLEIPAIPLVAEDNDLNPRHAMQLMAWQRQAEISADRAGLICCGSIKTAATAMFKVMSGLTATDLTVDPQEFAGQWKELAAELSRDVRHDHWTATHPFPPLRMHAMLTFGQTSESGLRDAGDNVAPMTDVNAEIESMLGMINPLAREGQDTDGAGDPVLSEFFLWGGLYVAASDGRVDASELDNLATVVGRKAVDAAVAEGVADADEYRRRFEAARERRHTTLTALEIQRIFAALAAIAKADGRVDDSEIAAMQELAGAVGISDAYVSTLF